MAKKGYTNKTEIENYLLTTIDATFNSQVDNWIESMENYIDQMTGRNFIADAVSNDSDRYYDGDNTSKLLIDDAVEITELEVGEGSTMTPDTTKMKADGDYVLYPANRLPITRIQLRGGYFPNWPHQAIRVKARWGYSEAVPADIKQVATVLVAGIINYGNTSEGEVKSMNIGSYSVTYKDEKQWQDFERVAEILKNYKKFII
jgi:hypothetical protein